MTDGIAVTFCKYCQSQNVINMGSESLVDTANEYFEKSRKRK